MKFLNTSKLHLLLFVSVTGLALVVGLPVGQDLLDPLLGLIAALLQVERETAGIHPGAHLVAATTFSGAAEIANVSSDKTTKQPRLAKFISLWSPAKQRAPSRSAKKPSPASFPGSFLHTA